MNDTPETEPTTATVRGILLRLARHQDDLAAQMAAAVPHWTPCPPSVAGHRAAATALRAQADEYVMSLLGVAS